MEAAKVTGQTEAHIAHPLARLQSWQWAQKWQPQEVEVVEKKPRLVEEKAAAGSGRQHLEEARLHSEWLVFLLAEVSPLLAEERPQLTEGSPLLTEGSPLLAEGNAFLLVEMLVVELEEDIATWGPLQSTASSSYLLEYELLSMQHIL